MSVEQEPITRCKHGPGLASQGAYLFQEFVRHEAAGGILLLLAAIIALVWANSPWSAGYDHLWHASLMIGTERFHLTMSLRHWVNDGLMAIFFFVVGLEIKREVLAGELAAPAKAALPIAAALGGVALPAAIFLSLNTGRAGGRGWGIPMATDIAFSLGVLTLLGSQVPVSLKIFLTALAIVDDIAAVLVIAIFYTGAIAWDALGIAALCLVALLVVNRLGIRQPMIYGLIGLVLWIAVLESGIHATIAGVLLALTIPASTKIVPSEFLTQSRAILDEFAAAGDDHERMLSNGTRQEALQELDALSEAVSAPLQRLEHALHPWVAFAIMPIFALVNAGVTIEGNAGALLGNRVTLGVVIGLLCGKFVGITLASWLTTRGRLSTLPPDVTWRQIIGVSFLGGIGFTMSLFITDLAFIDEALRAKAKIGILIGSVLAGVIGWLLLWRTSRADATGPIS